MTYFRFKVSGDTMVIFFATAKISQSRNITIWSLLNHTIGKDGHWPSTDYQFKDLVTYFQFEVSGDTIAAQLGEVCCNQPRFPRRASGQNCRFLVIFRENFSLKMCLDFLPFTFIKIPKRNTCTWSCLTRIFDRSHQTHSIPLPLSGMMISNSYLITLSLLYI